MPVDRVCKCCGAKFKAKAADVKRGWALFCSKRCKAIKQEQQSGDYAAYQQRQADRDYDHAQADPSWDAHKMEIFG